MPVPSDSLLRIWSNVSGVRDSSSRATRFTRRSSGMAAASYFPPCRQTSRECVFASRDRPEVRSERPGVLELDVDVEEPGGPTEPGTRAAPEPAVAFTELVGPVGPGIASW